MGCETECGSLPLDLGVNRRGGDCGFAGFAGFSGALVGGVTGSLANTATTVASGATLAGNGTLGGPTTINGTLSPGDGNIATLRINNSLTLAAGSTTAMEIARPAALSAATSCRAFPP